MQDLQILVVEDDPTQRAYLSEALAPYGEVHAVGLGQDAIQAFNLALASQRPFGLVFMDLMLPDKSGHQVMEELRMIEERTGAAQAVVVVLSALDSPENASRAFFQGQAANYLTKPVSFEALESELARLGIHPRTS